MLTEEGFDHWAPDYDGSVSESERDRGYPFAGYRDVLDFIEDTIRSSNGKSVLDLGFGTAALSSRLYEKDCEITGVDFSGEMLKLAQEKMPRAALFRADFTRELPHEILIRKFDFIVGTYSFHHVPLSQRPEFMARLAGLLTPRGRILIGDVMFPDAAAYEACRERFSDLWDRDEVYFTADEFTRQMEKIGLACAFQSVSFCAGVLSVRRS